MLLHTNNSSWPSLLKYHLPFVNYQGPNTLLLADPPYGGESLVKEGPEKAVGWAGIFIRC